jgi:hypothetical protein
VKLIIFTYSPTGLGHLRVTDALAGARPKDTPYVILGSFDKWMNWMHRISSINPVVKQIFLSSQYGLFEDILTHFYRFFLVLNSGGTYKQLLEVINKNPDIDEFQIVATHPGLAHQIGAIKNKLTRITGKKIHFIVQVTDDTYQHIWLVRGADLTIVPSHYVKDKFEEYAKAQKIEFVSEVVPYPTDVSLTSNLPNTQDRSETFKDVRAPINIIVPISGAAVGLPFLIELIRSLVNLSKRFKFWVIVRKASYTDFFVSMLLRIPGVNIVVGKNDNEMISLYELIYQQNLIHLEITKPSEQAFKAIIEPSCVGGSVLLFAAPLGRQEVENISFLRRHRLCRKISDVTFLQTGSLRSLILEESAAKSAGDIYRCATDGIFERMGDKRFEFSDECIATGEVGANGASLFWKVVERYFG